MTQPMVCGWCDEPVEQPSRTPFGAMHRECATRGVVGSVGHLLGRCPCYGGTDDDPPGMTRRQAALLACEIYQTLRGRPVAVPAGKPS